MISSIITFFQGRKSYFIALLAALTILAYQTGHLDSQTANSILVWLFPAGLVTLKAGQTRIEEKL